MITVAELRQQLNINPDDDHELIGLRDAVVQLWEQLTGGKWDEVAGEIFNYTPSSTRERLLWLPRTPVTTITTIGQRRSSEALYTDLASDAFILENANTGKIEKLKGPWLARVRVTYTGGFSATTCPEDIRDALFVQARFMRERIDGDKLIVKGTSTRQGVATFMENAWVHPRFQRLAQYRRRKLG